MKTERKFSNLLAVLLCLQLLLSCFNQTGVVYAAEDPARESLQVSEKSSEETKPETAGTGKEPEAVKNAEETGLETEAEETEPGTGTGEIEPETKVGETEPETKVGETEPETKIGEAESETKAEETERETETGQTLDGGAPTTDSASNTSEDSETASAQEEDFLQETTVQTSAARSTETAVQISAADSAETTGTNLADFLTSVVCNAPTDENGSYIINMNEAYELTLSFRENENLQFDNEADLVYRLPEGLQIPDVGATGFDINIVDGNGSAVISNNTFEVVDGKLIVRFHQADPNIDRLKALANVGFSVTLSVRFDGSEGAIVFNSDIEKDFVFESNSDLSITKQAAYDYDSDTAQYVLTVTSFGHNENVRIQDTITGTALKLNGDVTVTSSIRGALSPEIDYASIANGFVLTVPKTENEEVLTVRYSAAVDNTKITGNGTVEQTNNKARASSEQVPGGKEAEANFSGQVRFHRIAKTADGEAIPIGENLYEQTWKIEVNKDHKMVVGGTWIQDWIVTQSRPFMLFSGDGITVRVTMENGDTEIRNVPWDQLRLYTNSGGTYGWGYLAPDSDGKAAYEITCKTQIDTSGALNDLTLRNGAQVYNFYGEAEISLTGVGNRVFDLEKRAITDTANESEWEIVVHADGGGYPELQVVDDVPKLTYDGTDYLDYFQPASIEVEGLLDGETYRISTSERTIVLTFYQDEDGTMKGLKPTEDGTPRDITIRFKTSVNRDWLDLADANGYERYSRHTNHSSATVSGNRKQASAYVTPRKESIRKEYVRTRSVEIDGVTYPVFCYVLTLNNPGQGTADVADAFDTDYLRYYAEEGITVSGGTAGEQSDSDGDISAWDTTEGIHIRVSRFPAGAGGDRYPVYKISYALIPKDKEALDALNRTALEQDGYGLKNAASWNSLTSDTVEVVHTYYPYVDKELAAPAGAENDYVAEFKLIINKYAEDLDPSSDLLYIQDVLSSNLRFVQDSLSVAPAADSIRVQFDSETNTLTFLDVPDNTKYEVTYRARVLGKGNVTYSNTVKFGNFEKTVEDNVRIESSGTGSGSNPSITLVKRDAEDLNVTLSGAAFQLFYISGESPVPVTDRDGAFVYFTTGADGTVLISGNQSTLGWTLWEGRTYQLVEVTAPSGYRLNDTPAEFILTETPSSRIEYDLTGDRLDVLDERSKTENGETETPDTEEQGDKIDGGKTEPTETNTGEDDDTKTTEPTEPETPEPTDPETPEITEPEPKSPGETPETAKPADPGRPKPKDLKNIPKTGDESDLTGYFILILVSGGLVLLTLLRKKRQPTE